MKNKLINKGDYYEMILSRRDGNHLSTMIDEKGIEKLKSHKYKWIATYNKSTDSFYVKSTIYLGTFERKPKYRTVYLHRFLTNSKSDDVVVDHINHDTLDNRFVNLRVTNRDKNTKHRKDKNTNNTTGYRNVTYEKASGRYIVQLQINGKNTRLGTFTDVHEAGEFAEKMRKKYYKFK